MAENTGAIVTLEIDVTAEYTCSACGKENRLPDSARVTGSMASILALKKAGKGRDILPLLPGGLNNAGLQCRCGCGHREVWAKLRDPLADKIQKISLWALAVFAAAASSSAVARTREPLKRLRSSVRSKGQRRSMAVSTSFLVTEAERAPQTARPAAARPLPVRRFFVLWVKWGIGPF